MIIGVMSDSHDHVTNIRRAIEVFRSEKAECLLHAGDFIAPFAVREILRFPGPAYGVFGNNDGERDGIRKMWDQVHEPPHGFVLGGRRILVTHDALPVDRWPADMPAPEVVISGHTHQALAKRDPGGFLALNPGETGGWLTGKATAAVLDTDTMGVKIVEL